MGIEIRRIGVEELSAFQQAMGVPFGIDPSPELAERFARVAEIDRLRAAFDGGRIVATFGAYSLKLTAPGGALPTAGTTVVTVLPTHRRRGILRSLMAEHLAEAHDRNEPLAALWARRAASTAASATDRPANATS